MVRSDNNGTLQWESMLEQTIEQTIETPVIWDTIALIDVTVVIRENLIEIIDISRKIGKLCTT